MPLLVKGPAWTGQSKSQRKLRQPYSTYMSFFSFNKKRGEGKTSNIAKLRSPYLKKLQVTGKIAKRVNRSPLFIPPARLKPSPSSKWKRILTVILSIGIAGFSIYALYFSDYFIIEKYEIMERKTMVESYAQINELIGKYLGSNLILLNEAELQKQIKIIHPEIATVRFKKIFPHTIRVEFDKYPTAANIVNIVDGVQKKFLADSQGFLIEENSENPDLPYIKIETKEVLRLRTTFLSDTKRTAERLTYMTQAISLYEEKFGMKILYAQFKPRERELHLYTEKFFFVMLDMEKTLNTQIEKLKKALAKLDIYSEPLVYIDLRISGTNSEKVIFKRKK